MSNNIFHLLKVDKVGYLCSILFYRWLRCDLMHRVINRHQLGSFSFCNRLIVYTGSVTFKMDGSYQSGEWIYLKEAHLRILGLNLDAH